MLIRLLQFTPFLVNQLKYLTTSSVFLEAPALTWGVFVGIISGFVGATAFNKYYNFRKLPEALSFFNGKRFVPFVVIVRSAIAALVFATVWPVIQSGINGFGIWIANSQSTAPILAPFLFGTLERLLLPFGLHHMLTIPINYTQLGGTYQVLDWCCQRNKCIWTRSTLVSLGNRPC